LEEKNHWKLNEYIQSPTVIHSAYHMHVTQYSWAILPCCAKTTFGDAGRIAFDLQADMEEHQN
jgi:hypothetical protein